MKTPLDLLPLFLELSESLNISRTAEALRLSQPAVSRQLLALEESLGVQLFHRQSRGLSLTQAGRELRTQLAPSLEAIARSLDLIQESASALKGTLSIGCLAEVGVKVFAPLLFDFKKENPQIHLDLRLLPEAEIIQKVSQGTLGLGVTTRIPQEESVRAFRVLSERIGVFCNSEMKTHLEEHSDPEFVAFRAGDPLLRHFYSSLFPKRQKQVPKVVVSVSSHQSMIEALQKFACFGVLPYRSVEDALKKKKLKEASRFRLNQEMYLIQPLHEYQERRYEVARKFLIKKCRELESIEKN